MDLNKQDQTEYFVNDKGSSDRFAPKPQPKPQPFDAKAVSEYIVKSLNLLPEMEKREALVTYQSSKITANPRSPSKLEDSILRVLEEPLPNENPNRVLLTKLLGVCAGYLPHQ